MTDISKSERRNLIEQFIIAQPRWIWGSCKPPSRSGQHPGWGRGSEPRKTLEIWHFQDTK